MESKKARMNSMDLNQREIDEIVARHRSRIPVQVISLARELGLRVMKAQNWQHHTSGAIVRTGDSFTIWTNALHSYTRRRFTIAHEIGHFVLHRELIGDGVHDDALFRSELGGNLETEANRFAADLLMPKRAVYQQVSAGCNTVNQLADKFRVSPSAMSIRLGFPSE